MVELFPLLTSQAEFCRSANFVPFVMVVLRVSVRHEWDFLMDYLFCLAAA